MIVSGETEKVVTLGVTFESVQAVLTWIYFGHDDMPQEEWDDALKYVLPMQHNIENPITHKDEMREKVRNTFIEYWIDDDDRLTQDVINTRVIKEMDGSNPVYTQTSECQKIARITLRFLGSYGEAWAKLFHHLAHRPEVSNALAGYCNAQALPYIGPIRPINVDYFGPQASAVAYDIVLMLQYTEVIKLPGERLGLISIAAGSMGF